MQSQSTDYCAADPVTVEIDTQNRMPGDAQLYTPKVYNMTFWAVYRADGSSDYTVDEDDALEVIANMNREFNKFNVFFKYRGVNYLYNDAVYYLDGDCSLEEVPDPNNPGETILVPGCDGDGDGDCYELTEMKNFAGQTGNFDPNGLNTYIYYDSCGFSGFWSGSNGDRNVYVRSERFNDYHTVHELGHMFGLSHTWTGMYEYDPNDQVQSCEHVTRSVANPDFNADTRGDSVIDTDAMQRFSKTPGDTNYVNPNSCDYDGTGRDCQNEPFDISNDSSGTLNFMNDGSECPTTSYSLANDAEGFTIQQGLKMRLKIESTPGVNRFGPAETTIASLFEPYKGTYPYILNSPNTPYYQPGFSYDFIECDGDYPTPAPYGESFLFNQNNIVKSLTRYQGEFNGKFSITHPNHSSIVIQEINTAFNGYQTEKCWDLDNGKPKSGVVTKFNDNTYNYNTTSTYKNETEINDPQMIPNLEPGLYKIEREYNDGTVDEVIIQKGNQ